MLGLRVRLTAVLVLLVFLPAVDARIYSVAIKSAVVAGASAEDWRNVFACMWDLEEATGAQRDCDDLTVCGVAGGTCDLSDNGSVVQSSIRVEGSFSTDHTNGGQDFLDCAEATCEDDLAPGGADSEITFGCWFRPVNVGINMNIIDFFEQTGADTGYILEFRNTGDLLRCRISSTGITGQDSVDGTTALSISTWAHVVCRADDDETNELVVFLNGASDGTSTMSGTGYDQPDGEDFSLGGTAGAVDLAGRLDECFIVTFGLSDAEICRVCSCGIDGLLCTCNSGDATLYDDDGRNSETDPGCGSCTLPDCDAVDPTQ